jgi:hypothetical protein
VTHTWERYCDKKQDRAKEIRKFEETAKGQELQQRKGPSKKDESEEDEGEPSGGA